MKTTLIISSLAQKVSQIPKAAITLFKSGATITIISLAYIIISLNTVDGGYIDGAHFYYLPMLEQILMSFVIYFGGMLLYDITARSYQKQP